MTAVPALAERLAQSRERLRQALNRAPDEAGARPQQTTGAAAPWWVELKSLPGAAIVIEAADTGEGENLFDDYSHRSQAALKARMRVGEDMTKTDLKVDIPPDL